MNNIIVLNQNELQEIISEQLKQLLKVEFAKLQPHIDTEQLLKVHEIAEILKVSPVTIAYWKKHGKIPFRQIGRRIFYEKNEVLNEMAKLRNGSN